MAANGVANDVLSPRPIAANGVANDDTIVDVTGSPEPLPTPVVGAANVESLPVIWLSAKAAACRRVCTPPVAINLSVYRSL